MIQDALKVPKSCLTLENAHIKFGDRVKLMDTVASIKTQRATAPKDRLCHVNTVHSHCAPLATISPRVFYVLL